jgi:spermidine/putrescine transport system substrate-binding protein
VTPGNLSRRTVLKGLGGAAFLGVSGGVLSLFGTPSKKQTPEGCPSVDLSDEEKELVVSSWPAYIDPIDDPASTLSMFERVTGIAVRYTEDVTDNQTFFAKVVNQLGSCQPVGRDLFVLTDWMASRMIRLGWLQKLDHAYLPNVDANLLPQLRHVAFDPGRSYSVPWQSGFTGIAYNASLVPEVRSFADLLTRDDLRGRITLLTEMQDTMAFMLKVAGADPRSFDEDDWAAALEILAKTRRRGQVRAFLGNDYLRDLAAGNIVACSAWSGDIVQLQADNPNLRWVVPEEGLYLFSDNMMVPNLATHKTNAERWMNHYYDPEVAARLAAHVNYICPVAGARSAMERIDPSLVDNPLVFPTPELLARTFEFMPLDETQARLYQRDFADAIGG